MLYCLEYMFDRLKRGEWHGCAHRCAQCTRVECFKAALLLVLQAEGDERKLLIHELKIMLQRYLEPLLA